MTTLLKHEFFRTRGLLGLVGGIAVLVAGSGILLALTGWPLLSTIGIAIALVVVLGLVPATQVVLTVDFWRSSFGRVGYLTQTLPRKGATIYWAKLVWAWLASLAALALAVGLFLLALPAATRGMGGSVSDAFASLRDTWTAFTAMAPTWAVVAAVLMTVAMVLIWPAQYYFAASVGSQAPMNRLGVGGPVLVWLGLYVATQVLVFLSFAAVPLAVGMQGDQLGLVRWDLLAEMAAGADSADVMPLGFLPALLLITVVAMAWSVRSWNRKVSLL